MDEHKQWSEKVLSHRFCLHMLDKNRNYEVPPEMGEIAQTFMSEIEWLAALKCRTTGLSTSLFLMKLRCSANLLDKRMPVSPM